VPHFHDLIWGVPRFFPCRAERGEWIRFLERPGSEGRIWETYIRYKRTDGTITEWGLISEISSGDGGPEDCFADWMARNWYEVVGSGDLYHYSMDAHGHRHGTELDLPRDGQAVRNYVMKPMLRYVSKEEVEACHASPYFQGARSWGVRGGQNIPWGSPVSMPITRAVYFCLLRAATKYVRAVTGRGRRFRCCSVFSGDPQQWARLADYFLQAQNVPF
jgi:hypothetical protein